MSRRRRPTLILSAVALLTLVALVTANTPVGAWGRSVDTRSDDGLNAAPLLGKTFRVLYKTTCAAGATADTWQFLAEGELVSQTLSRGSWQQNFIVPSFWSALVSTSCASFFELNGWSFGPIIVASGFSLNYLNAMFVVGILD